MDAPHPGWSFPTRVLSEAVPSSAPAERLIAEARARGYTERCPDPGPGELCSKTGRVRPRSGDVLEPLLLGYLLGPDAEIREHLPIERAPKHLIDAIVTSEDRSFFEHHGIDLWGIGRAALANAREGGVAQGGSTLTMQVVRAFSQERERSLGRKLREAVMALAIDRALGKRGVLQAYLDIPYLAQRGGVSVCGFQAAARHFFGKDAHDLDLAEAATLAVMLPAPGHFAPDRHPDLLKQRRDRLLQAMASLHGYDVKEALREPVSVVTPEPLPERHPAYLSAVRAWLEQRYPAEIVHGAGLVVTAGVDLQAQQATEQLFERKTREFDKRVRRASSPLQSAGVLLDSETGRILAIWGGIGLDASGFNRATQALRQAGSSFKPLVYALAFSQPPLPSGAPRFTASSLEPNEPRRFEGAGNWMPRNAEWEQSPTASLAEGLIWSRNIATASLLEDLGGPDRLIDFAARLGFDRTRLPHEMGLALGQGEVTVLQMTQLAAAIANGGWRIEGSPVLRIVDYGGHEVLGPPSHGERAMPAQAAALTRELMRQVILSGTGGAAYRGIEGEPGFTGPAIGKTGTTDHEKDLWFIGATPGRAAALWLGHDTPEGLGASASDLAAPLWGIWMRRVAPATKADFPGDVEIEHRWICATTGRLAGPLCRALEAPFLPGTTPRERCEDPHLELLPTTDDGIEGPPAPTEGQEGAEGEPSAPAEP